MFVLHRHVHFNATEGDLIEATIDVIIDWMIRLKKFIIFSKFEASNKKCNALYLEAF